MIYMRSLHFKAGFYGIDPSSRTVWVVVNKGGKFALKKSSDGDQDGDGDIDNDDVAIVISYRNQPASVYPLADLDGDNKITILDARKLALIKNN